MNRTYQNPIAKNGDFADPFVLRQNGKYYLYATNPDIRCFISENLVDWELYGPVIAPDEFGELVPFAPEVVYANGKFYLYTSPSGFGHYVLESDSPTGPFRKITGNAGHAIDGTVFIDDDGKWYFYWAGDDGIWGCEMKSPVEFGEPILTGADLHGWTEGPLICKHDGVYYMTYTGNHYLSNGYRIQTAWSKHPLTGYRDDEYNPALIHTEDVGVGLGHSSTVIGPDLVSYYLVYHNLNPDATRDLNIDRIIWHREATQILGPTRTAQTAPKLPDYSFPVLRGGKEWKWEFLSGSCRTDSQGILYSGESGVRVRGPLVSGAFTAELNFVIPEKKEAGGMKNACGVELKVSERERYSLEFDMAREMIQWYEWEYEKKTLVKETKMANLKFCGVLHTLSFCTVQDEMHEKREDEARNEIEMKIDGRVIFSVFVKAGKLKIGYFAERTGFGIGYTAVTESTYRKEKQTAVIPENCSCMPVCGTGKGKCNEKGYRILQEGEAAEYEFQAGETGEYVLYITMAEQTHTELQIFLNEEQAEVVEGNSTIHKVRCFLEKGNHTVRLMNVRGEICVKRLRMVRMCETAVREETGNVENSAQNSAQKNTKKNVKKSVQKTALEAYGKELFREMSGDDYVVEAKFRIQKKKENGRGGVLLRVTEPSEGGEGADKVLGTHFFLGYSVSVDGENLRIAKHCYDNWCLGEVPFPVKENEDIHIYIAIQDNHIRVFDERRKLLIEVYDSAPLEYGCTGLWVQECRLTEGELRLREQ